MYDSIVMLEEAGHCNSDRGGSVIIVWQWDAKRIGAFAMKTDAYVLKRIEAIERELHELKKMVSDKESKPVSLRGVWRDLDISDQEIEEAKRSLSKGIDVDDVE